MVYSERDSETPKPDSDIQRDADRRDKMMEEEDKK